MAARPGVMEHLDRIEHMAGVVAHEVRLNGGASVRDTPDRVDDHTPTLIPDE